MPETSIVIKAEDRYSSVLKELSTVTKAFNKDSEELERTLHELSSTKTLLKTETDKARKTMQEAQKQFEKTGDAADGLRASLAGQEYEDYRRKLDAVNKTMRETEKQAQRSEGAFSKLDNRAGKMAMEGSISGFVSTLSKAGVFNSLGDSIGQMSDAVLESAVGQSWASLVSSIAGGALTGAAMGSVIPGIGTAAGAAVGAVSGLITGGTKVFQAQDDAFKSYVQEGAEGQLSARDTAIASGSSIAGSREQKQLAFSTLLGSDQAAEAFLGRVKSMAAKTNYTYDEITGYAKSLVGPFGAEASLGILNTLSDASAALSLSEGDNQVLIAGLSRMKLTDKTTQEYLNYFSERGVDVYEALSRWGDAATVAEKVTAGQIKGSDAAQAILDYMDEQYGGLSEKMANTYEGMMGNLEDARANAEEAYGIGYNAERREGVQAETEWLESGAMDEANKAIGAWQAQLENEKERYVREAVKGMMETDEYQQAQAEGDAAEMGRLIMQAKVQGMNEYNASDGAQEALAAEKALVAGIRDDASLNADYWDAGYEKGQEYTKGLAVSIQRFQNQEMGRALDPTSAAYAQSLEDNAKILSSHAYGLNRVPYDNFPALLHEGERVLTAREARRADQGGGTAVSISGNTFVVRQESDVSAIAEELLRRIETAQRAGVR